MSVILIVALLLGLGGGTSAIAEQALPGDTLYEFKTNVNEQVREWVSLSQEAKADWEAQVAVRRLEEAEKLTAKSQLDAETKAQLETNFKRFADRAEERLGKIREADSGAAAEIAARFETALKAHERILSNISSARNDDEADDLIESIREELDDAKDHREKAEAELSADTGVEVESAAEGMKGAAENKIKEAKKFLEAAKANIGAEAAAKAEVRLKAAEDAFTQGDAKLEAKAYGEAFALFREAHSIAQESKLLINAKAEFESENESDDENGSKREGTSTDEREGGARGDGSIEVQGGTDGGGASGKGSVKIDLGL